VSNEASCSVCGRTILKGENTRTYLTPDGEPRTVCDLCRSRAEALHWVWAELANSSRVDPSRRRRGSLVGWLKGLAPKRPEPEEQPVVAADDNGSKAPPQPPPQRVPDPAARGARVGRAGTIREPGTRLERAVARFNESEHARTVAGLTKTLGQPLVSVGAAAGSPNEIRLTVAWELSWYQWGVDLGTPSRPVFEIDKGHEIAEIDEPARQWNAHTADGGGLRLGTEPARAASEPARSES
jgi:hypothetical protein